MIKQHWNREKIAHLKKRPTVSLNCDRLPSTSQNLNHRQQNDRYPLLVRSRGGKTVAP